MNKRELLDRAAATAEERMTLARVLDKYEQCRRGSFVTHTDLLTPQEQSAAEDILRSLGEREVLFSWGGVHDCWMTAQNIFLLVTSQLQTAGCN